MALANGPVLFLLGTMAVVWRAMGRVSRRRLAAACAVVAVAVIGTLLPALVTWAAMPAVLGAFALVEGRRVIRAAA